VSSTFGHPTTDTIGGITTTEFGMGLSTQDPNPNTNRTTPFLRNAVTTFMGWITELGYLQCVRLEWALIDRELDSQLDIVLASYI
jgi:hypothetical protein